MEQNRAPALLPHQPELARAAADQLPGDHQLNRRDHHQPGLKVFARLDERDYPKKVEVSDRDLAAVNLTADPFHPEWNYAISPTPDPAG